MVTAGQGFHFDTRPVECLGGHLDRDCGVVLRSAQSPPRRASADSGCASGMSSRSALGGLDGGDARNAQHVTLFAAPGAISASVSGCITIRPPARATRCVTILAADVDHVRLTGGIEMGKMRLFPAIAPLLKLCAFGGNHSTMPVNALFARASAQHLCVARADDRDCRRSADRSAAEPARSGRPFRRRLALAIRRSASSANRSCATCACRAVS